MLTIVKHTSGVVAKNDHKSKGTKGLVYVPKGTKVTALSLTDINGSSYYGYRVDEHAGLVVVPSSLFKSFSDFIERI